MLSSDEDGPAASEGSPAPGDSERLVVLRMLESGKVSVNEALRLLQAVEAPRARGRLVAGDGSGAGYRFEDVTEGVIEGQGPADLHLEGVNGSIVLHAADGPSVRLIVRSHVREVGSEEEARAIAGQVAAMIEGRRVSVRRREDRAHWERGLSVSIEAFLPRDAQWRGALATSNGPVEVEELTLQGLQLATSNGAIRLRRCAGADVSAATSNGAVEADDLAVRGLRLATSNGAVRLRRGTGEGISVATSNGAVEAEEVRGHVDLRTSNSPITVALAGEGGVSEVHAATSNAGIEVRLPAGLAVNIDAATSHGSFETQAFGPQGPQASDKSRGRLVWRSPDWEAAAHRAQLVLRTSNAGMRFVPARD